MAKEWQRLRCGCPEHDGWLRNPRTAEVITADELHRCGHVFTLYLGVAKLK
jgi:hypothetical protein